MPIKIRFLLKKFIGAQIVLLGMALIGSVLSTSLGAAPVYQCVNTEGTIVFSDSRAQLYTCQELSFELIEEELRTKGSHSPSSSQSMMGGAKSQDVGLGGNEFFESPSHVFEDEEFSDSPQFDTSREEFSDEEI